MIKKCDHSLKRLSDTYDQSTDGAQRVKVMKRLGHNNESWGYL